MRQNRGVEARTLRSMVLLGATLALVAGHAQAQKSPPPPPPPPMKGKVYPKAKDYGQPARILKIDLGQKKIDPKLLKTAPTVDQVMRQRQKGKAIAKATGTPAKPKGGASAGKTAKPPAKPPAKSAPKTTDAKKTPPKKTAPKKPS